MIKVLGNTDKDALYLFFIENVKGKDFNGDFAGYMPLGYQSGFIYDNPNAATVAHELAHGAFSLYHTFSNENFVAAQSTTDNLMDYKGGTELWAYQWKLIHNPKNVWLKFLQEEEGEMRINDEDCWTGRKITWVPNTEQLYNAKKALRYNATSACLNNGHERIYYRLVDDNVFRVTTIYDAFGNATTSHDIYQRMYGVWIPVLLDELDTDCLSCDLKELFDFTFLLKERNIFFGDDFEEEDITGVGTIKFTFTLDYEVKTPEGWKTYVPGINRPKAEVSARGTVSDEEIDENGEDKYIIRIRIPEYEVFLGTIKYKDFIYENKLLKPLGNPDNWKEDLSLGQIFIKGLQTGFYTGLAEVVSFEASVLITKWVSAVSTRFIVKTGAELKTHLSTIVDKPAGVSYRGKMYRNIETDATYSATSINPRMIAEENRYRQGLYLSETKTGNIMELNGNTAGRALYEMDINVTGLLDLSDVKVVEQLGTTFDQMKLVNSSNLIQYEFTQEVAIWAKNNGYAGIKYYGAQSSSNYINYIIFDQTTVTNSITNIKSIPW